MSQRLALLLVAICPWAGLAAPVRQGESWAFSVPEGMVAFDAATGALRVSAGARELWRSDPGGLWSATFEDQTVVNAADSRATVAAAGEGLRLTYAHERLEVTIEVAARADGVELTATATPHEGTLLGLGVPGRMVFDPTKTARLIQPDSGTQGVGTAYAGQYFARQDPRTPSRWVPGKVDGPAGYLALYGGPLAQGPDRVAAVDLQPTDEAAEWLPAGLVRQLAKATSQVNRPPAPGQWDVLLVDSADGPWLSGKRFGDGLLWRIGALVGPGDGPLAVQAIAALVQRQLADGQGQRQKVGLLRLPNGPERGSWTTVEVAAWAQALRALPGVDYVELPGANELLAALASGEFAAVVNPYGEGCVAPANGGMAATVAAVRAFAEDGGAWCEVGGYPFYYSLEPVLYYQNSTSYPPAMADFLAIEAGAGRSAIYRAALPGPAWDRERLFVPGRLASGGDEAGGWCERPYSCYVPAGQAWQAPAVRVVVGGTVRGHLAAYATANGLTRALADKLKPEVWERFRQAVMVKLDGSATAKTAALEALPQPTLIHFSDYLKGGFDKEYPDHLPPNPSFGTPDEFRDFLSQARAAGHLTMPYTNPTWWCDDPRGPTFEAAGEAPLLRRLDGSLSREAYGEVAPNTGYSITMWHPAVQAANRRTRTEFLEDYPVDILFQDQCGARGWRWDTNPASPNPAAYAAGMISLVDEDSAYLPLSTEGGWDGILNAEAQFCGLSWDIVPTSGAPRWRTLKRTREPADLWSVYPLAQYLAQDKVSFIYHDLGQFVTNREVLAWTLGLGFNMTYRCRAEDLAQPATRDWIGWLSVLQKEVCSRYLGGRLVDWEQTQSETNRGRIRAEFEQVKIVANLDPAPTTVADQALDGFGFRATGTGLVAGDLPAAPATVSAAMPGSFVATGRELWVYQRPELPVTIDRPDPAPGRIKITFDGQPPVTVDAGATLTVTLPAATGQPPRVDPPSALANLAPADWPGGAPSLGVVDIPGLSASWTVVTPAQWTEALRSLGLPVVPLTSQAAVAAALAAGATRWLAIINPYGETFPALQAADPMAALAAITEYVRHGGSWVETGGHSFYTAVAPDGRASLGPRSAASLGLDIGNGPVEAPLVPLQLGRDAAAWYGARLEAATLAPTMVNRELLTTRRSTPDVALLTSGDAVFLGAYRLGGWGYLWRLGGFRPAAETALPAVVEALRHLLNSPPAAANASGPLRLFHATLEPV